jgi:hypothetical protein
MNPRIARMSETPLPPQPNASKKIKDTVSRVRKRFVWFSAISLGAIFSGITFNLGANNMDELMVSLGLRAGVHSVGYEIFRFGDLEVSVSEVAAMNLTSRGVPFRQIEKARVNGQVETYQSEGAFRHPAGLPIGEGSYLQGFVNPVRFEGATQVYFCNVTARYRRFIPVYHYHVGVISGAPQLAPVSEAEIARMAPYTREIFDEAADLARAAGWRGEGPVYRVAQGMTRFTDSGTSFRWSYCDRLAFGE